MLNTMTRAVFSYKGYVVYAKRLVDALTGKVLGWSGDVSGKKTRENLSRILSIES